MTTNNLSKKRKTMIKGNDIIEDLIDETKDPIDIKKTVTFNELGSYKLIYYIYIYNGTFISEYKMLLASMNAVDSDYSDESGSYTDSYDGSDIGSVEVSGFLKVFGLRRIR